LELLEPLEWKFELLEPGLEPPGVDAPPAVAVEAPAWKSKFEPSLAASLGYRGMAPPMLGNRSSTLAPREEAALVAAEVEVEVEVEVVPPAAAPPSIALPPPPEAAADAPPDRPPELLAAELCRLPPPRALLAADPAAPRTCPPLPLSPPRLSPESVWLCADGAGRGVEVREWEADPGAEQPPPAPPSPGCSGGGTK
jgi:hypothetical protein